MSDFEFTFVESPPPPKHGRNALYAAFREALKARPNEWAIYPREFKNKDSASSAAANINRDRDASYIGYEARSSDGVVYVRYVGGAS